MSDETAALVLALATKNEELLVETAVDAGEMHARLEEARRSWP